MNVRILAIAASLATAGVALAVPPTGFVYPSQVFKVEPDFRRCVSPLCGGWWLTRVNHTQFRCPDGTAARRCYVAAINFNELGLSVVDEDQLRLMAGNGEALIEGEVEVTAYPGFPDLGVLHPTTAWTLFPAP